MTYNYEIYQTPVSTPYKFMSWEYAEKSGFNLKDYVRVYSGVMLSNDATEEEILEHIYTLLNTDQPSDYHAHSLSLGDVVRLNNRSYYVDSMGFHKV